MSWIIQGTECYKQQLSLSPCWMQINWFHILRSTSSFGFGGLHGTHLSKLYRKLAICWWWHPSWSISRRRGRLFSYSFVLVTFCGGFFCWRLCSLFWQTKLCIVAFLTALLKEPNMKGINGCAADRPINSISF